MRYLLLAFLFLISLIPASAQVGGFSYPYILNGLLACAPRTCYNYEIIPPGWVGETVVFALGNCLSGIKPSVTPRDVAFACTVPTLVYAQAFASPAPFLSYYGPYAPQPYRPWIYAQQIQGSAGTYRLVNSSWVSVYQSYEWSDCLFGALRTQRPPAVPC